MALPTTALQFHCDASVNTNLWQFFQAGTPYHNTPATHGSAVQCWDDVEGKDLSMSFGAPGVEPIWISTTPLMALPNLDFNGTTHFMELADKPGVNKTWDQVISATVFLMLASIRIEGGATNSSNAYENDSIIGDSNGYRGIHVKNNAGAYSLQFYNYTSGASNVVTINVAVNTNYVIAYWHTGTAIFAEVYSSGGLVGSGNTASGTSLDIAGKPQFGRAASPFAYFNGKIGEVAIYDVYNSTDKTTATDYFKTKWVPGGAGAPVLSTLTPNSAYANASVPVTLVGVAITGTGLTGGAFDAVSGFTFANLSITGGGATGTVDIQIATAKAAGAYNFTFTTTGGTSAPVVFTVLSPAGGTTGDTGGNVRFNAGFN